MEYRINTNNENYIILRKFDIYMEITILSEKNNKTNYEKKILKILEKITSCIFTYKNNIQIGRKPFIDEIAIHKSSELGEYIINSEEKNRKYITLKEIINALLACIEKDEWFYYETLTYLIQKMKLQNIDKIEYINLKNSLGTKRSNFIIENSKRIPITYEESKKIVYLFQDNALIKTDITIQEKNKTKTLN